jgi:hypothetical protein
MTEQVEQEQVEVLVLSTEMVLTTTRSKVVAQ